MDSPRSWPIAALVTTLVLVVGLFAFLISQHLFVFSEARHMLLWPYDLDPVRFFLLPQLEWGNGRLSTVAVFQLSGAVCGANHACVNAVGAGLVAVAAGVLLVHTRQLLESTRASLAVALLWVLSPTVLATLLWQSARFDVVALIAGLATSAFWWEILGRPRLSAATAVGFIVASLLLMAVAFNAKELDYYLVGALVILAVVRGQPVGAVRRNLVLAAAPLAYAAWFMAYGLLTIDPVYAANSDLAHIPENLDQLVRDALGLNPGFMGVWQVSPDWDALQRLSRIGFIVVGVGALIAAVMLLRRFDRRTLAWPAVLRYGRVIYLVAIIGAMMLMNARSAGAAAYYMMIPYWAGLTLGVLLLMRLAGLERRFRILAIVITVGFVFAILTAYLSHFSQRSTYRALEEASTRMRDIGSTVRVLLDGRSVERVSWRTIGQPRGWQYALRGVGSSEVGDEMWPWLVEDADARPPVTALLEGDAASLASDLAAFDGPGEVLVAISEDYRLELLAWEGEILFQQRGLAGDAPVGS